MPVQFLSEAEHKSLNRFPSEVSSEDLNRFFLLSDKELSILKQLRAEHNRLGFALQLCCLRYLGFFPEELQLPEPVIYYVAQQLQLIPELLVFYGQRSSTQREHQRKIQALLGYRRASNSDLMSLEQWLVERALEHNQPLLLFHMACEHLKQSLYNFTDDLIEMVDQRLWELYNQAKRNFDSDRLLASKTIDEKLKTLQDIGQILLDVDIEDNSVRVKTFEYITPDDLKASLKETKQLIRPENDAYVDYFGSSYNRVRRFSSKLLATLKFQVRGNDSGLLTALNLVHEIHQGRRRKLPDDAPTEFIPEPWQPYVIEAQQLNRRYYELAALWLLRQQLRSGDIYLAQSRRFSELETYFIPPKEWSLCRDEVVNLTGTPIDAKLRLAERKNELVILMGQVEELLNQPDSDLREEKGKLVLTPFKADEKTLELKHLAEEITARLPRIEITDLEYPLLKEYIQGTINQQLILDDWDEMLRLVGSLKMGWVTASLIIQKLQAFPRKHPLMRVLQEYGRLLKTIHILRWYADETNRRRLKRQLNKGEALHILRSHLFYANQGEIKTQQDDQLLNQVGCLNLVTNAIIFGNTVYIDKVVQQLRLEGYAVDDEDLKHIWPTRHTHINVYGQYHFDKKRLRKKYPLRALRNPNS